MSGHEVSRSVWGNAKERKLMIMSKGKRKGKKKGTGKSRILSFYQFH